MRASAIVGLVVLTALFSGCGSDSPPSNASRYVALGDSTASGAGLPTPSTGAPANCYRTDSSYPSLAAKQLRQDEFDSVACSGAGMNAFISEMALYPSGEAPPQFNALKGNETIVSVTIGVNDVNFGEFADVCLKARSPSETPCQDKYVSADGNKMTEAAASLAKPLGEKLDAIHDRSPAAKIYVVGYAPIIPEDGAGCWGRVNVSPSDAPYFYGFQNSITETEKTVAEQHGATYVDFFHAGAGHDACKSAAKRWANPEIGAGAAGWPLHPTLAGAKAAAALLAKSAGSSKLKS